MAEKATIVGVLGERDLLLPHLVRQALAANDRAKYYFTLLQLARGRADALDPSVPDLRWEREVAGVNDERFDQVIAGSSRGKGAEYHIPFVRTIVDRLIADVRAMIRPLHAAGSRCDERTTAAFERRLAALADACTPPAPETIASDLLVRLTSANRGADSLHLLLFDVHRAIEEVGVSIATEDIDGAKVYGLDAADRPFVAAFQEGVHSTEAAKLGHPGLGTLATRSGTALVLENDIGETAAHVLVVRVEGLSVVVTHTDVHLQRLDFFRRMLAAFPIQWSDVRSRSARELLESGLFYECVGTLAARDRDEVARFLTHLGSRLVFLIDWNRARKALRVFVPKKESIELLDWAAGEGVGHRGFLEMGGEKMLFDAMAAVVRTPMRFGERLDDVLGRQSAAELLRFVLRECSVGLRSGRSRSLIRAEIRAELARLVHAGGERLLAPVAEHAAIVAEMARAVRDELRAVFEGSTLDRQRASCDAGNRELRCDEVVMTLRRIALRMPEAEGWLRVVSLADDAADAIEEAAFFVSLLPGSLALEGVPLPDLGEIVLAAAEAWLACTTSARQPGSAGVHGMLDAVDTIARLEQNADDVQRGVTTSLVQDSRIEGKPFAVVSRVVDELERAVDAVTHAALALRDRLTSAEA